MKLNQYGFAVIESVLMLVIIAMVGAVGYYILHSNKQATSTYAAASKVAQSSPARIAKKPATVLTIPEWRIKGSYAPGVTLTYSLSRDGKIASLSSKELNTADALCAKAADGGGSLERYAPEQQMVYETGLTDGTTASQFAQKVDAGKATLPYRRIGSYFYFFVHSQGLCGANTPAIQQLQGKTSDAARELLKSLQAE